MTNSCLRGSEWGKWDLQVQTYIDPRWTWPSNYPTGEDKKLDRIDKFETDFIDHCIKNEIVAVAITDHNSGEAIDGLLNKNKLLGNPISILPGVEVISSEGIHIIIIFNPSAPKNRWATWAETVRQFLTAIDMPQPAFHGDGNNTPAASPKPAEDIIGKASKFDCVSIFAHAHSTNGGLFCKSDSRIRRRLLKRCNILDAAADDSNLSSRIITLEKELTDHGANPKEYATINTSDSRRIEDVGSHFTWIKANPTFNGLKQIIYEPKDRVSLNQNNPYSERQKFFIEKIKFSGSKNFIISNNEIPLNREMIAVIGGRGSGKSALLESIAFLNEAHSIEDLNGKKKVIEFYRRNVENKNPAPGVTISVRLVDKDGNSESYEKDLEEEKDFGLPFLYVGQEQLSALATNDGELRKKICELLNLDTSQFTQSDLIDKGRDILTKIKNLDAEIKDLLINFPEYKGGDFNQWITNYIKQKEEQKTKLSSEKTKNLLEEISNALDRGMKLKDYKNELENLSSNLGSLSINNEIENLNKLDKKLFADKYKEVPLINLTTQRTAISSRVGEVEAEMMVLREKIIEMRRTLASSGLNEDISVLMTAAATLQREINTAIKIKESYLGKNKLLNLLVSQRNKLYEEIQRFLEENKKQINNGFSEFLKSREDSKAEEIDLFKRIIEGVSVEGEVIFNQNAFCSFMLANCVDRRTIKTEEDVKALIAGRNEKGQASDITLETLSKWIEAGLDNFLRAGILNSRGMENLLNYLFTEWSKFLVVRTIVKLKDIPIEKLSVGQRGTLLLKIYLATASVKQIFIIDQPEDNLDNQFIMNELIPLIREIKKSRQIILSTHNANLVVNADSEQIIVARLGQGCNSDYTSGGIENPSINNDIKEILEGGEQAFINREKKYGMGKI